MFIYISIENKLSSVIIQCTTTKRTTRTGKIKGVNSILRKKGNGTVQSINLLIGVLNKFNWQKFKPMRPTINATI